MRKAIYLVGAGGLGREIAAMLKALPEWELKGFYDDFVGRGSVIAGTTVLGSTNSLLEIIQSADVVISVGDPTAKRKLAERLSSCRHIRFPSLVHPTVTIMDPSTVHIGPGSIVSAGCVFTTSIVIREHVLINLNCTVGHDSTVGSFTSLMPGVNLAGGVQVSESVLIGSGAQVINGVNVRKLSRVGSGAVVVRDVDEGATVVGVPARRIEST